MYLNARDALNGHAVIGNHHIALRRTVEPAAEIIAVPGGHDAPRPRLHGAVPRGPEDADIAHGKECRALVAGLRIDDNRIGSGLEPAKGKPVKHGRLNGTPFAVNLLDQRHHIDKADLIRGAALLHGDHLDRHHRIEFAYSRVDREILRTDVGKPGGKFSISLHGMPPRRLYATGSRPDNGPATCV